MAATDDDNCEHGEWVDGICKCDEGYVSVFTNEVLYPKYCTKKYEDVPLVLGGNEILDFFHYLAISATLLLVISGVMVYAYFWYTVVDSWLLSLRIADAKKKLEKFRSSILRRGPDEDLSAEIWYPDMNKYICVNDPSFTIEKAVLAEMEKKKIMCAKVTHEYKPQKSGELKLEVGDIITNVSKLKSGWCKGKLDGKSGYFSEAYVQIFETMVGEDGQPILNMTDYMAQSQSQYLDSGIPQLSGETPDGSNIYSEDYFKAILGEEYTEYDKEQLIQYWQQTGQAIGGEGQYLGGGQYPGDGGGQYPGDGGGQYPGDGGGQYPGDGGGQYPGDGGGQYPGGGGYFDENEYRKYYELMTAGGGWYGSEALEQIVDQPTDIRGGEDRKELDHHGGREYTNHEGKKQDHQVGEDQNNSDEQTYRLENYYSSDESKEYSGNDYSSDDSSQDHRREKTQKDRRSDRDYSSDDSSQDHRRDKNQKDRRSDRDYSSDDRSQDHRRDKNQKDRRSDRDYSSEDDKNDRGNKNKDYYSDED